MKIKTIKEVRELGLYANSYLNGDWKYRCNDGYWHLIRNGEELLPKIKKLNIVIHYNGDWEYKGVNNRWHKVKGDNNEN